MQALVVALLVLLCFAKSVLRDAQNLFLIAKAKGTFSGFSPNLLVPPAPFFPGFPLRTWTAPSQSPWPCTFHLVTLHAHLYLPQTSPASLGFLCLCKFQLPSLCWWLTRSTPQMSPDSNEVIFPKSVPLSVFYNLVSSVSLFSTATSTLTCLFSNHNSWAPFRT